MADTPITAAELGNKVSYRQTTKPRIMSGSFVANDTDYHVMELDMRVQAGLLYGATNPSNKDMVVTLYGAFESGVDPGDAVAFPIDTTGFTVAAGESNHEATRDKFPYYLIRCKFSAIPDGKTVIVKANSLES